MNDIFDQDHTIPVQNPTYPMANLKSSAYAAPLGFNRPTEALGGYDTQVNPMTGQEMPQTNFARGGLASLTQPSDDFTRAMHAGIAAYAGGGAVRHFKTGDKVTAQDTTMYTGSMIPGLKTIGASNIEGANSPHAMTGGGLSPEQIEMLGSYASSAVGANKDLPANELQKALAERGVNVSLSDVNKAMASAGYKSYGTVSPGLVTLGSGQAISTPSDAGRTSLRDLAGNVLGSIAQGGQNIVAGGLGATLTGSPLGGAAGSNLSSKSTGFANWVRNLVSGSGSSRGSSQAAPSGDASSGLTYDELGSDVDGGYNQNDTVTGDASDPDWAGVGQGNNLSRFTTADDNGLGFDELGYDLLPKGDPSLGEIVVHGSTTGPNEVERIIGSDPIKRWQPNPDTGELEEVTVTGTDDTGKPPVTKPTTTVPTGKPVTDTLEEHLVTGERPSTTTTPVVKPVTTTTPIERTTVDPGYTGAGWTPDPPKIKAPTGSTGIVTTTTAGGVQDQPADVGVPKEGAGTGTGAWTGIPLAGAFRSPFDPMYSASTSAQYGGSDAQNLQDYMANLNQSLRPGPITPYTFQTAPARVATPQGIASVAPSQGPGTTNQITPPSRMQAQGVASVAPTQTLAPATTTTAPAGTTTTGPTGTTATAPTTTTAPQYAANIPLIEKYALELGVKPEEILNIANLTQQGKDINYFLTGGGQDLINARAGQNVAYNPEQGQYIKTLIDRMQYTGQHAGETFPGGKATYPSFYGYNAQGQFVGDLPGGAAVSDNYYLNPKTGQMEGVVYDYTPGASGLTRVDAYGNPVTSSFTGPTVTAGSYTSPTWPGTAVTPTSAVKPQGIASGISTPLGGILAPPTRDIIADPMMPSDRSRPFDEGGLQRPPIGDIIADPMMPSDRSRPFDEGGLQHPTPTQAPITDESYYDGRKQFSPEFDAGVEETFAHGGIAHGGIGSLAGTYKAGGKLLRGPGDGMSDSIPAVIHGKKTQRAALADGEFVIPADVVSHLGNGSTDAGARKLYAMMDKIRQARTGRTRQAPQVSVDRYMPKA